MNPFKFNPPLEGGSKNLRSRFFGEGHIADICGFPPPRKMLRIFRPSLEGRVGFTSNAIVLALIGGPGRAGNRR
jgi:hypothetical protein